MIKFKKAKQEDKYILADICRDAARIYDSIMPGAFERQAHKFESKGLPSIYYIHIISKDNEVIGFLGYENLNEIYTYLTALYIKSDFRRKGYGKEIIERFIVERNKEKIEEVILLAHKDAFGAVYFYQKCRFEIISSDFEKIKLYKDGILSLYAIPSTVLMSKKLYQLSTTT